MRRVCDRCGKQLSRRRGHGFPYRAEVLCGGCELTAREKPPDASRRQARRGYLPRYRVAMEDA